MIKPNKRSNLEEELEMFFDECKESRTENQHGERDISYLNMVKAWEGKEGFESAIEFVNWMHPHRHENLWIGITGSWRNLHQEVIEDVVKVSRYILDKGYGISVGGSLGVPFLATEIALKEGSPRRAQSQLIVSLPFESESFLTFYKKAFTEGLITRSQAESIINQLAYICDNFPDAIFDNTHIDVERFLNPENKDYRHAYHHQFRESVYGFRNSLEGYGCDGIIPFCIGGSDGVLNTVDHVELLDKPVFKPFEYEKEGKRIIRDYAEIKIQGLREDYPLPFNQTTLITS